jgi:hypothetical protein
MANMNVLESTNSVAPADDIELTHIEEFAAPRRTERAAHGNSRARYVLLFGIALLSAWLASSVFNSINEINAEMDMIRTNAAQSRPFLHHMNENAATADSESTTQ